MKPNIIAIDPGVNTLTVRLFTLTADTGSGMTTEIFDTEEAQFARMNELMAEDAEEQDIKLSHPGSNQWLNQWSKWRYRQALDNNYYSWDEHTVTLGVAQLVPVNRPEIPFFNIEPVVIPPDFDGRNLDRASWASACIKLFMKITGCDEEDAVHDLITDLAHWCDRKGMDFNEELNHAANMYNEETSSAPMIGDEADEETEEEVDA
jgi:hypothetical protein